MTTEPTKSIRHKWSSAALKCLGIAQALEAAIDDIPRPYTMLDLSPSDVLSEALADHIGKLKAEMDASSSGEFLCCIVRCNSLSIGVFETIAELSDNSRTATIDFLSVVTSKLYEDLEWLCDELAEENRPKRAA